jgi:hypothetical protein
MTNAGQTRSYLPGTGTSPGAYFLLKCKICIFFRGRCISFMTGIYALFFAWSGLPERGLEVDSRSALERFALPSSTCGRFRVLSMQNIALCSDKKGTGAMLVVSKASRKSSIPCCAK